MATGSEVLDASIEGQVAQRPIAHLLCQLFRKQVTGRLTVRDDSGDESLVFVREGGVAHVDRPNDQDRLDKVLLDAGLVSRNVMVRAQELAQKEGKQLGQVLLGLGAIGSAHLTSAIRSQLRRKLVRIFFISRGTFALFIEDHAYGNGDASLRLDPRGLLYHGIKTAYDDPRLLVELKPLENRSFRTVRLPDGYLEALGLNSGDPLFRSLAGQGITLADLSGFPGKASEVRAAVLTLLYCDLLSTRDLSSSSGKTVPAADTPQARTRASTTPPAEPEEGAPIAVVTTGNTSSTAVARAASDAHKQELIQKVDQLFARLETINHFEILGLTESASPAEVSAAYMKAIKTYHPDRLAGMGLANLSARAEKVVGRMTEASQVLADPKKRTEYVRAMRGEKSEAGSARNLLEAEQAFKDGEQCLKRGDMKKAMALFTEAVQKSPKETEYRAYLAWARYMETPSRKDVIARDTLRLIGDALKERPNFARGYFWTGKIQAQLGALDLAEKDFRKCLEIDHDFIDAQRELRLIEMRAKKGGGGGGGDDKPQRRNTLLDKILKR